VRSRDPSLLGVDWFQIFDFDRFDFFGRFEVEDARVEIEFGVESAFDVFGFAKTVLLAFVCNVSNRHFFAAQCVDHCFGLAWRHDFVFQSLKEDHRTLQLVSEVDRRAIEVILLAFGIGTVQFIAVPGFEFVCVCH